MTSFWDTVSQAEQAAPNKGALVFVYETGILYYYNETSTITRNGRDILNVASGTGRLEKIGRYCDPPIGSCIFLVAGSFSAANNGGSFTSLPTNSVAGVNTYVSDNKWNAWLVADGTAPNDSESPLFNTASKFMPNLTNSRFTQGFTSMGGVGASNGTASSANENNHTHNLNDNGWAQIYVSSGDFIHSRNLAGVTNWTRNQVTAGGTGTEAQTAGVAAALDGVTASGSNHNHTITISAVQPNYLNGIYLIRVK